MTRLFEMVYPYELFKIRRFVNEVNRLKNQKVRTIYTLNNLIKLEEYIGDKNVDLEKKEKEVREDRET